MPYIIIFGAIAIVLMMWFFSTQRSLAMLDETINNAMGQIGVQLSSRWDALSILLDLTKDCAEHEFKALSEAIESRRPVTAGSCATDAAEQENLIFCAMSRIVVVAEHYPVLKVDQLYQKTMDSANQYEGMARQSTFIYNDSVTKFNRQIRIFPTSVVAKILGFDRKDYLEIDHYS